MNRKQMKQSNLFTSILKTNIGNRMVMNKLINRDEIVMKADDIDEDMIKEAEEVHIIFEFDVLGKFRRQKR